MNFNKLVSTVLEAVMKYRWEITYDGRKYNTYASTKRAALANIGVRIAKEKNYKREVYPRFIKKVIDMGRAVLIEEKCWKGYKQIGMKKKGKRTVPNCVKNKIKKTK